MSKLQDVNSKFWELQDVTKLNNHHYYFFILWPKQASIEIWPKYILDSWTVIHKTKTIS